MFVHPTFYTCETNPENVSFLSNLHELKTGDVIGLKETLVYLHNTTIKFGTCNTTINFDENSSNWIIERTAFTNKWKYNLRSVINSDLQTIEETETRYGLDEAEIFKRHVINQHSYYDIKDYRNHEESLHVKVHLSNNDSRIIFSGLEILLPLLFLRSRENRLSLMYFFEGECKEVSMIKEDDYINMSLGSHTLKFLFDNDELVESPFGMTMQLRDEEFSKVFAEQKLEEDIKKDVELESLYHQSKEQIGKDLSKFIQDNDQLKTFLADYMAQLLHHKPSNVYEFTRNQFAVE
ncbi:hypothetical protein O9G_003652 [Rozella allomycis CSF55]|uniref:Uncharacterized protein n=1 Tax=Rozella allomycis (strain CSF55) TaxID=988480 RepID=A0A075B480_ROZAC|nr:hypothetical protein O9G_003652 [Rozella allomycis CSF55]|eukprot:EPZ36080.1 hypothetical protein O9G_003652 [Rozella allomycis CSF55]